MLHPRTSRAVNPQGRRKLSLKQIRAGFGGKRRQAAAKRSRSASAHKHRAPKATNPKRHKTTAKTRPVRKRAAAGSRLTHPTRRNAPTRKKRRARRRESNPGPYLLTMSPVLAGNPTVRTTRRKTTMAKTRRRRSAKGRSGTRHTNPTRRRRVGRSNTHHRRRSRNPFGESGGTMIKTGAGVFVGFSAGKKIPPMLGPSMNSSPMMSLLSTAITAGVAAWIAKRFMPGAFATGVLWGGVGSVFNVAWNAFAPASIAGYAGVGHLGDMVPGGFPLPQTPVGYLAAGPGSMSPAMMNQAPVNVGAFGLPW